ncbi:MAG: hypothetical protein HC893_11395, partial [Chloroflexaceae bacterium]|nr:hypothetical protein [Chloroflexaceae bacterium]
MEELASIDLLPFSLDDLGIDSDISAFSFGEEDFTEEGRLSLTDAELASLDFSSSSSPTTPSNRPPTPRLTSVQALQRLVGLGQQQGYVDLTDIINVVDNPIE